MEVKGRVEPNGTCHVDWEKINADPWRTSKMTLALTMRLFNVILSMVPRTSGKIPLKMELNLKIRVNHEDMPAGPPRLKFEIQIDYNELKSIPDWHLEKLTHWITQELCRAAFADMAPPKHPYQTPLDPPPEPPKTPKNPFDDISGYGHGPGFIWSPF